MDYLAVTSALIAQKYPVIVYAQPRLMDLPPGTILGSFAYSIPGEMRFILDRSVEIAPGVLPADIARTWIKDLYTLPLKRRKVQMDSKWRAPIHAIRGLYPACVYLDIKQAYLTVLKMGYDVEYHLGEYLGGEPVQIPPVMRENKLCYSIAVTMSGNAMSHLEVIGNEGVVERRPFNVFSNPCLFALAQDTLNGIGSEMLALLGDRLVYANIDGYIVDESVEQAGRAIIESWGFTCKVRKEDGVELRGETLIRGVGNYRIAHYDTKRHDNGRDFTNRLMGKSDRRWLKTAWSKWMPDLVNL